MKKLLLLRPEPGLSASAERARGLGLDVIAIPLFRVEPVAWSPPDPACFDGLLLTSANAIRHGGADVARYNALPVHAVGSATADAARDAGFTAASVGERGVDQLLDTLPAGLRLLHLVGEDRHDATGDRRIDTRIVYRSTTVPDPALPPLGDLVIAVHSPRAGARLSGIAGSKRGAAVAAISNAAARTCGAGWSSIDVAATPDDASLLALAARLCQNSSSI